MLWPSSLQCKVPFTQSLCWQRWNQDLFPVAVTPVSLEMERNCSVIHILIRVSVTGDKSAEDVLAEQAQIERQVRDSFDNFHITLM